MNSFIFKSLFVGAIISLSSAVFALPDISGNWKCQSQNPSDKKVMSLSGEIKKTGDTYSLINWKEDGSDEPRSGTALHTDKLKNSLAVIFWPDKHPEDSGFGIYKIHSQDKIAGVWTPRNGKVAIEETCERVKA